MIKYLKLTAFLSLSLFSFLQIDSSDISDVEKVSVKKRTRIDLVDDDSEAEPKRKKLKKTRKNKYDDLKMLISYLNKTKTGEFIKNAYAILKEKLGDKYNDLDEEKLEKDFTEILEKLKERKENSKRPFSKSLHEIKVVSEFKNLYKYIGLKDYELMDLLKYASSGITPPTTEEKRVKRIEEERVKRIEEQRKKITPKKRKRYTKCNDLEDLVLCLNEKKTSDFIKNAFDILKKKLGDKYNDLDKKKLETGFTEILEELKRKKETSKRPFSKLIADVKRRFLKFKNLAEYIGLNRNELMDLLKLASVGIKPGTEEERIKIIEEERIKKIEEEIIKNAGYEDFVKFNINVFNKEIDNKDFLNNLKKVAKKHNVTLFIDRFNNFAIDLNTCLTNISNIGDSEIKKYANETIIYNSQKIPTTRRMIVHIVKAALEETSNNDFDFTGEMSISDEGFFNDQTPYNESTFPNNIRNTYKNKVMLFDFILNEGSEEETKNNQFKVSKNSAFSKFRKVADVSTIEEE